MRYCNVLGCQNEALFEYPGTFKKKKYLLFLNVQVCDDHIKVIEKL
jgi:hypothetical protein